MIMPLSRMMGAGSASSTVYNTNVNLNTLGGKKKQGIAGDKYLVVTINDINYKIALLEMA